jgi:hypothetical protein
MRRMLEKKNFCSFNVSSTHELLSTEHVELYMLFLFGMLDVAECMFFSFIFFFLLFLFFIHFSCQPVTILVYL